MSQAIVAIILAMLAAKADPQETARKAFSNCLITEHNKAIEAKSSVSEFNKAAQGLCMPEKTAYHDILAKSERSYGSSAKEAEQFANEESQMMVDYITSAYSQNTASNSNMVPEP